MGLFSRKKYINREEFPIIIDKLGKSLQASREEYVLGSLLQLKREGIDTCNMPKDISPKSELEDALKGFELTSVIGIAWKYIESIEDQLLFDSAISKHIDAGELSRAWGYREKYTDCQGEMDVLANDLSIDVYKLMGSPGSENEFKLQFHVGAYILIGICQADTYSACGDYKMEHKVRKKIKKYIK